MVSEALDATGVTTWASDRLIAATHGRRERLVVALLAFVALLTVLVTPNASVAALIPMAAVVAIRVELAPSKLLIPLAFAAHAGSLLALTGSPVNVRSSARARTRGAGAIGFFARGRAARARDPRAHGRVRAPPASGAAPERDAGR